MKNKKSFKAKLGKKEYKIQVVKFPKLKEINCCSDGFLDYLCHEEQEMFKNKKQNT